MFTLAFYVPPSHVDIVKNALFKAGAGKIGNYCCCAWQVLGEGQFLPLAGSNPHLGTPFTLEKTPEYRVEMVCTDDCVEDVLVALRETHPYEEPAYHLTRHD